MAKKRKKIRYEDLKFSSYEGAKRKIEKKIGKMPKLPSGLLTGEWSEQAMRVLSERYLQRDAKGRVSETPQEMSWRVSWEIASADALWGKTRREVIEVAKTYYNLLVSHEFLPNSPTLMNAGTGNNLQFSACFVLPVEDSMEGIFDALKYQALIHKSGGGTGFSFSRLRPCGSMVRTSGGVASGPVSFMRVFDAATNEVKQGGKRRGANMGILRVDHPDIMEFIHCKEEGGIENFNISVGITNKFMEAYAKSTDYELVDPKTKGVVGTLNAAEVMDEIAEGAWRTGDPGVIFLDRMNEGTANPVPSMGPVESTNPCGEQPLYPFDSCNLGSLFLPYFVKDNDGVKKFDWKKLKSVTELSVRFMDGVIEMNPYPLDQIRQTSLAIRRIGLGVGGWADLLVELGIAYDSEEALELGGEIMKVINERAIETSEELANERGEFPMWSESIYKNGKKRRNSTVTTIAPTGSISIIAGTSSGIEPMFALSYQHIVKDKHLDRILTFVSPAFERAAKEQGIWSEELKSKLSEHGTVRDLDEVPEDLKRVFGTSHEISYDWHIKTQAVFQEYTENAVSKTINMVTTVTSDDIKRAYLMAWETGCQGITVFRDGCKDVQVLNSGIKSQEQTDLNGEFMGDEPILPRPFMVKGATYNLETPVGSAFITINENEESEPLEVFINVGKGGSDVAAMAEALGRLISTSLRFRSNLSPKARASEIAHQLSGIGGRRSVGFGKNKVLSLPDAISSALSVHYEFKINGNGVYLNGHSNGEVKDDGESVQMKLGEGEAQESVQLQAVKGDLCPFCGSGALVYEEGCTKCYACGHSEC